MRMHDGGLGPPLPVPVVRAAMAVRLAGFVRGGAGVRLITARGVAAMLNAGVHPIVPANGSVGASDLMHMAAIAQVLIGGGSADHLGTRLPGADAMRRAGIPLLALGPKEGLALVSANGVSIGHGALVVERAERLMRAADVVAALSLRGRAREPLDHRAGRGRGEAGGGPGRGRCAPARAAARRRHPSSQAPRRPSRIRSRSGSCRRSMVPPASLCASPGPPSRASWRPWTTTRWSWSRSGGSSAMATSTPCSWRSPSMRCARPSPTWARSATGA